MNNLYIVADMGNCLTEPTGSERECVPINDAVIELLRSAVFCDDKIIAFTASSFTGGKPEKSCKGLSEAKTIGDILLLFADYIRIYSVGGVGELENRCAGILSGFAYEKIYICGCCHESFLADLLGALSAINGASDLLHKTYVVSDATEIFGSKNYASDLTKLFSVKTVMSLDVIVKVNCGAFVGKFLPPHIGHTSVIDRMLTECDRVVIVVSDNPEKSKNICKETSFPYFSSEVRASWLREHYAGNPKVSVFVIDESEIEGEHTHKNYARIFKEKVQMKINSKYADSSYRQLNDEAFPECRFVEIERDIVPVHATMIRQTKNLDFVIDEAKRDIKRKLMEEIDE